MTYLLKVTSWENDADNYNTVEIRSEDATEIAFYIKVAKLFYSENAWGDKPKGFGNADREGDIFKRVDEAIDKIVAEHIGTIPKYWSKAKVQEEEPEWWAQYGANSTDFYSDNIYDLIGYWLDGERYRVFEGFKVFKVSDIIDVTSEF